MSEGKGELVVEEEGGRMWLTRGFFVMNAERSDSRRGIGVIGVLGMMLTPKSSQNERPQDHPGGD